MGAGFSTTDPAVAVVVVHGQGVHVRGGHCGWQTADSTAGRSISGRDVAPIWVLSGLAAAVSLGAASESGTTCSSGLALLKSIVVAALDTNCGLASRLPSHIRTWVLTLWFLRLLGEQQVPV